MVDRFLGKLGVAISVSVLLAFASNSAFADFPASPQFPQTDQFKVGSLKDKGAVARIELTGNYDLALPNKDGNIEPRTVVAKEFLHTHEDRYDFLVVFSNFEFETGNAKAAHIAVQNQVKGIGIAPFDNSAKFGSKGKLQGYIDMAALSRYVTNPYDARFDDVLQTFAHQFLHQWGARVRFRQAGGDPDSALLGKDASHWSFLLNSGASVGYGNQWRDNGNGSFTSVAGNQFFSPLDLYLMGLYSKEEVAPFFLIRNPEVDSQRLPENDVSVTGVKNTITIDDVVAAEGPREPDAAHAQKEFRLGFVLLSRPGAEPTEAELAAVEQIRRAISTRLAVLTGGRILAHSYLEPKAVPATGTGDGTGPAVHQGAADVNLGMNWLRTRQSEQGAWSDSSLTTMRDTAVVFDALSELDRGNFAGRAKAEGWMREQATSNTDYLARQIRALAGASPGPLALAQRLLALQNSDGGWGVAARYQSNALDTALALQALTSFESTLAAGKLGAAVALLERQQNQDGGWGNLPGGASRTAVTATVVQALKGRAVAAALMPKAIAFLASRQQTDGGFGDGASTVHDTANALAALLSQSAMGSIRFIDANAYVSSAQLVDGSWDGSVYSTALALRLLKSSGLFNWTAVQIALAPASPLDGQQAVVQLKVANTGTTVAPAGMARVYDGDPQAGGKQIGNDVPVPPLAVGDSADLTLLWDTRDKPGQHLLVLQVDPDNTAAEAIKADNRAQRAVVVQPASVPIELALNASDIHVTPAHPNRLPAPLAISALIANIGQTDAEAVRVVLRTGGPDGVIIAEQSVNLLGRSQQVVNFSTTLTEAGSARFTITIDPDARVADADRSNNTAAVTVETVPTLDLEVLSSDVTLDHDPVYLGADATFRARIRNAGTQPTPPFQARFSLLTDTNQTIELTSRTLQLGAGKSSDQTIAWQSDRVGNMRLKVELDPDAVMVELDKANNQTVLPFKVAAASGMNLSVSYKDFVVNPVQVLEGQPVTLSQTVRNSGTVEASNIEVAFYDGEPAAGHMIGSGQTIAALAAGASAVVQTTWSRYPDAGDHLIYVVVDPASRQPDTMRDDNAAFLVLSANSMPDLAISGGDLQVTPDAPAPGDALRVRATVSNLGQQAAKQVVVRAFDGEPNEGGKQVGSDQIIPVLAGLSSQTMEFAYPASGTSRTRAIVIVIDPANSVAERNEENNSARRTLGAQDGNFFVNNRYFSPNGDQIKDSTVLDLRLTTAADITVSVLSKAGKVVRVLAGDGLNNTKAARVVWDGLNGRGAVVADGDYVLRVEDSQGNRLGQAEVTVDNNRSSLLDAVDTPSALITNLSCDLQRPEGGAVVTEQEDRIFLQAMNRKLESAGGLFSMHPEGGDRKLIVPGSRFGNVNYFSHFATSQDGLVIAWVEAVEGSFRLWVADKDGTNARTLAQSATGLGDPVFTANGSAVLATGADGVMKYPVNGAAPVRLKEVLADEQVELTPSPDRRTLLVASSTSGILERDYVMIDVDSGQVRSLPDAAKAVRTYHNTSGHWTMIWSPDSQSLLMSGYQRNYEVVDDEFKFWLFNKNFDLVKTFRSLPDPLVATPLSTGAPVWNSNSSEFAYEMLVCSGSVEECTATPALTMMQATAPARAFSDSGMFRAGNVPQTSVLMVADIVSGKVAPVASTSISFDPVFPLTINYFWVPQTRTLVREGVGQGCKPDDQNTYRCFDAVDLDGDGTLRPLFVKLLSTLNDVGSVDPEMTLDRFTPSGNRLLFKSSQAANEKGGACEASGPDQYAVSSLLNMTADLRAMRSSGGGGVLLRGTATDANFARYVLEYARKEAPTVWTAMAPASDQPVVDALMLTWAPPAYGNYLVRLTVEDKAGNARQLVRSVSWADTPSITDLYKDADFASPNGDNSKDTLSVHYRVVDPVHLIFTVRNDQQQVVRTVEVDHAVIDSDPTKSQVFKWDGRDDRGRLVPDGQYTIAVLDFEFSVTIDTELPRLQLALTDAYARFVHDDGNFYTGYAAGLTWKASDGNLAELRIERGTGEMPAEWSTVQQLPQMELEGTLRLKEAEFLNQRYRALASDKAGNVVEVALPLGAQQVFLLDYANHQRKANSGNEWADGHAARYPDGQQLGTLPKLVGVGANAPLRFDFAETIRAKTAKVVLQYRALSAEESRLPLSALDSLQWEELRIAEFVDPNTLVARGALPGDNRIAFVWDMQGVPHETPYLVRIKVTDADGATFTAASPYILQRDKASSPITVGGGYDDPDHPGDINFDGQHNGTGSGDIDISVGSGDDPRFTDPHLVDQLVDVNGNFHVVLSEAMLAALDLLPCKQYQLILRTKLQDGTVSTTTIDLPMHCAGARWTITPDTAANCGNAPSGKWQVTLRPFNEDTHRLTQMQFGEIIGDVFNPISMWDFPVTDAPYALTINQADVAAGIRPYFVRVINDQGTVITEVIKLPVAHGAAEARITYPLSGQKVCGRPMHNPKNLAQTVPTVTVEGQVTSTSNVSQAIEVAPPGTDNWTTLSPVEIAWDKAGFSGLRGNAKRGVHPHDEDICNYAEEALCGDFHPIQWAGKGLKLSDDFPGAAAHSGKIGVIGLADQNSGEMQIRLRVFNGAGEQSCSAPVTFDFDNAVRVSATRADVSAFSPQALSGAKQLTLIVTADESVTATVRVHAGHYEGGKIVYAADAVRTLVNGEQLVANTARFTWDGLSDGGAPLADGPYQVLATYTDGCGNSVTHNVPVELDATAPVIHVSTPAANGKLGLQVAVMGSVRDAHLGSYVVEFASAAQPALWSPLADSTHGTEGAVDQQLAAWNTLGLTGNIILRVRAYDTVGNMSSLSVPLEVAEGGKVISYLEAAPAVFSPNLDGRNDTTALRFGLLEAAQLTLEIRRGSLAGPLVKTLIDQQQRAAGSVLKGWDGTDQQEQRVADGVYVARLTALTQDAPARSQEETIEVIVDTTKPELAIGRPAGAFVAAQGALTISANDANFETYKAALASDANLLNWKPVGEGHSAVDSAALLDLSTLAEGKYAIRLQASDLAGNTSELVRAFEIDNTAPKVALGTPLEGSFLSGKQGLARITGSIDEKNLDQYALRLGQGTPAPSWPALAGGNAVAPINQDWDVAALADGAYTLWLNATDRAGQSAEVKRNVVIDNTAPVAVIASPSNRAYVRVGGPVNGTASDANVLNYTIEIAPGPKTIANKWSLLYTGSQSVANAVLLDWQALPVDGLYTLRLKVVDKAANSAEALSEVVVDTKAPAAPRALSAVLEQRNNVHLSWSPSAETDLAGYVVLRDGVRLNAELLTSTSYNDPALANGAYTYEVKAVDKAGWLSAASEAARVSVNMTGPSARIFAPARGAIISSLYDISGSASAQQDFKEYRLFVGDGENPSAWRLLRRSPVPVQLGVLGSWDTLGIAENRVQSIKLEAEDIFGAVASDILTVTVDNTPPAAPLQLTAQPEGSNVRLNWNASTSSDVAGYIVLRDERIANAAGPVIGSWKPYLLTQNTYLDLAVPDGVHRYVVLAMDRAENLSAASNAVTLELDTHAPHALMAQPLANAHIGRSTYLLAQTADTDVASVQFQYKPAQAPEWINVGVPATRAPFFETLDSSQFVVGDYQIRAVATDRGGRVDAQPEAITVTFSEAAEMVTDLKTNVQGGDVTLTWSSNTVGLKGYVLERGNRDGSITRIELPAQASARYTDRDLPDFDYRYRVSAIAASGKPSLSSDPVAALVFTPQVAVPFTPTVLASMTLKGQAPLAGTLTLVTEADTAVADLRFDSAADGSFSTGALAVPMGVSHYRLRHADLAGNVSKSALFDIVRALPPAKPDGVRTSAANGEIKVDWNANSEPDLLGYRVLHNGEPNLQTVSVTSAQASSSGGGTEPGMVIDSDLGSWWSPEARLADQAQEQIVTLHFAEPSLLSQARVLWSAGGIVANYDLQIPAGPAGWTTIAAVRDNVTEDAPLTVPLVRASQLRIRMLAPQVLPQLAELTLSGPVIQTETTMSVSATEPAESFQVFAINQYGMQSVPAEITHNGAAPLPDLAVEAAGITLESGIAKAGNRLRLAGRVANLGQGTAFRTGLHMFITDSHNVVSELNKTMLQELGSGAVETVRADWVPMAAGTYTVTLEADTDNSNPENDENNNRAQFTLVVQDGDTGLPLPLKVATVPQGHALQLQWMAPETVQPSAYRIRVASAAAGPFTLLLAATGETAYLDDTAANGVRRYYVVTALDAGGSVIATSAPTVGMAQDSNAPGAPVLFTPTVAGKPITVDAAAIDIYGSAEAGATVALMRDGAVLAEATAASEARSRFVATMSGWQYAVSPDGRRLALDSGVVQDLDSGSSYAVSALKRPNTMVWSHRSDKLAVVTVRPDTQEPMLQIVDDAEQRVVQQSVQIDQSSELAWSPDDRRLALMRWTDNGPGLWLYDLATRDMSVVRTPYFLHGKMAWSPDGQYLAVSDDYVQVIKVADGTVVFKEARRSQDPSWSADGQRLLYGVNDDVNSVGRIAQYVLADNSTQLLTDATLNRYAPLWLGPSGEFVDIEEDRLILRDAQGGKKAVLIDAGGNNAGASTTDRGHLWYVGGNGELNRLTPPGSVGFGKVHLNAGTNLFTAVATDATGNRGAQAAAISVTMREGAQADLSIAAADMVVLPNAPLVGEASRISVTVRNLGNVAASNVALSIVLRSPGGVMTTLTSSPIAQLAGLGSTTLAFDWTPAESGQYTLSTSLDAPDTVSEANERNNLAQRSISVPAQALPTIEVGIDAAKYGSNAPLSGSVKLSNGGPELSAVLELRVEDRDGYLVERISSANVTLTFGQQISVPVRWNTGAVLAGDYRVVASLRDANNAQLASGNAPFAIGASQQVSAAVSTSQAQYAQQQTAQIGARIDLAAGNAALEGASALIEVIDAADAVLFSTSENLGNLLPGASVSVNPVWQIGTSPVGSYRVRVSVKAGAVSLATAETSVSVVAANSVPLTGALSLNRTTVANGDRLDASYTIQAGSLARAGLPLTVAVIDPLTQAVIASASAQIDVASTASAEGVLHFDVAGWPLRNLQVVLSATIDAKPVVLQRANVRVLDRTAPVLAFTLPVQGSARILATGAAVQVNASDSQSLVSSVEYGFGGSSWTPFLLDDGANALYGMRLAAMPDGPVTILARATDAAGNQSLPVALTVTVDNTAPVIRITGVAEGARYTSAVKPVVAVDELHPLPHSMTLDGAPYLAGTAIEAGGMHVFAVEALDQAGNRATARVQFELALANPVVAMLAPTANALVRTPLNVAFGVSGMNGAVTDTVFQIDGGAWMPAAANGSQYQASVASLADGAHTITARASDGGAAPVSSVATAFEVDNTAPAIVVSGVADGAIYNAAVTPLVTVTETHPDTVSLLLNGAAYVSGQSISAQGSYVLQVNAVDKAGNAAERTVRFTIGAPFQATLTASPSSVVSGKPVQLTTTIANQDRAPDAVTYRVQLLVAGNATPVQVVDMVVPRANAASFVQTTSWTPNYPSGAQIHAVLSEKIDSGYREIGTTDFVVLALEQASATLTLGAADVTVGAVQVLTPEVSNGARALNGAQLDVVIRSQPANTVVFTHSEPITLAAGANWNGAFGWTATVTGNYLATVSLALNGAPVQLAQAGFTVSPAASLVELHSAPVQEQRILVLSSCKRPSETWTGACAPATLPVDDPVALASCDASRAQSVTAYLDTLGVHHKLVTTEAEFALEVRRGGYTGYWVSGGGTKLHQPLQGQLRSGLRLGEGLAVDGMYGLRDSDQALETLVGVYTDGRLLAGATKLNTLGAKFAINEFDIRGDMPLLGRFEGAALEGECRPQPAPPSGTVRLGAAGYGHCVGKGNGHDENGDGIDDFGHGPCAPATAIGQAGLISGRFGAGPTLYFGFDWASSYMATPANTRWVDLGRSSFDWLRMAPPASGAVLIGGDLVTRSISVRNPGAAQAVSVKATLPRGASLVAADPAAQAGEEGGLVTVTWPLTMAAAEQRALSLQVKLPLDGGSHELALSAYSVAGGSPVELGAERSSVQVTDVATLGATALNAVAALDGTGRNAMLRAAVTKELNAALAYSANGDQPGALRSLVVGQTLLDNMTNVSAGDAQVALARLMRAVERAH